MKKTRLLLLLVLLMTAATGAWADETPIATILASENSTFVSGSKTFADKVKITFSGAVDWVNNRWQVVYDSTNGNEGTVTVEGVNGTNISKVVFYDEYGSHVMTTSPYTLYFYQAPELSDFIVCTGANGEGVTDLSMITKIEVFGGSAPTGYTVSLKDGVKDADKWTISPNPAPEGSPVTIQYTGRLKVKGVKATSDAAPAVKPAATVTTAPTAKSGVKAGEDVAIVTAGVATGGTMMYKVTTANTKPTSTEGFSATVPTAKTLAAGTFYVWYYVKADATHTDSEISATAIAVTVKARSANGQLDDPDDYLIEDDPFNF